MPCTRSSTPRSRIRPASVSAETSPPGSWWNDSIPTSAESSRFMRTYVADAGSSPTRIVARPGPRSMASTSRATCSRTRAATALPSITRALMRPGRLAAALQRCIVGHELALAAVAGEPHDYEAAGLDRSHYALAEVRMDHVFAEGERGTRSGAARRLADRRPAAPRGRRVRSGGRLFVAIRELHGDLVDEAAPHVPVPPAEKAARARIRQIQLPLRTSDADVAEPPLLLEIARLDRPDVREDTVLQPDDEHGSELEPLGVVQRHQGQKALLVAQGVLLREQRDLLQELLDRALLGGGVVLPRNPHELFEVLEPTLRLDRALGAQRLGVAGLVERLLEQVAHAGSPFGALAQALHHRHEASNRLDRRRGQPGHGLWRGGHVPDRIADRVRIPEDAALRGVADATSRRVHDPPEGHRVGGVHEQRQVGERVLDLGPLVEARAADHLVRDAVPHEHVLEHPALGIRPVEDRHVVARAALVHEPLDLRHDEAGLGVLVLELANVRRIALAQVAPERLRLTRAVVRDHAVGGVQDRLRRAVVLLELDHFGVRKVPFELEDVANVRAAEGVDALVVVANH